MSLIWSRCHFFFGPVHPDSRDAWIESIGKLKVGLEECAWIGRVAYDTKLEFYDGLHWYHLAFNWKVPKQKPAQASKVAASFWRHRAVELAISITNSTITDSRVTEVGNRLYWFQRAFIAVHFWSGPRSELRIFSQDELFDLKERYNFRDVQCSVLEDTSSPYQGKTVELRLYWLLNRDPDTIAKHARDRFWPSWRLLKQSPDRIVFVPKYSRAPGEGDEFIFTGPASRKIAESFKTAIDLTHDADISTSMTFGAGNEGSTVKIQYSQLCSPIRLRDFVEHWVREHTRRHRIKIQHSDINSWTVQCPPATLKEHVVHAGSNLLKQA